MRSEVRIFLGPPFFRGFKRQRGRSSAWLSSHKLGRAVALSAFGGGCEIDLTIGCGNQPKGLARPTGRRALWRESQGDECRRPASEVKQIRGLSSAGRAPALQAGGHRFDPDRLHQFFGIRGRPADDIPKNSRAQAREASRRQGQDHFSRDEDKSFLQVTICRQARPRPLFDIVNGFF